MAHYDPWQALADQLPARRSDWLSTLQQLDLNAYLPLDILTKVDRMSMAHSIEAREPLLDHKLVEFAATLPLDQRMNGGNLKCLLKRAMRGVLPDSIIDRPKRGFAVPLGRWFRGRLSGFVGEVLLDPKSHARTFFETRYIERLLRQHAAGRELDLHLWTLLSFELWCRRFLTRGAEAPVLAQAPAPAAGVALLAGAR
jgi:asparagine synthase (glutamine-hydrolysing)